MGNFFINFRIGVWSIQLTRDWKPSVRRNDYHKGYPEGVLGLYDFFGLI
jgi:hypothetical protein